MICSVRGQSVLPGDVKIKPRNLLQDVDAFWRLTHLKNRTVHEIGRRHSLYRRTNFSERMKNGLRIFRIRANPEVDVFCGARLQVHTEGKTPDDQIPNLVRSEERRVGKECR